MVFGSAALLTGDGFLDMTWQILVRRAPHNDKSTMVSFDVAAASGETPHDAMSKTPYPSKKFKVSEEEQMNLTRLQSNYETPKIDGVKVRRRARPRRIFLRR